MTKRPAATDKEREIASQAEHLVNEGNRVEDAGQIEAARMLYAQAIELMEDYPRAHLNLGNILLATGNAQGALECYATAARLNPDYAPAYYGMGNANVSLQRPVLAVANYHEALRLKPDFADAEVALGNTLEELQRFDEAIHAHRRALQIRPDYAPVYYNLGSVQLKLGRVAEAEQSCRMALELQPGLAEAHHNLGLALQARGEAAQAAASFRRAMGLRPDFGNACVQAYRAADHLCDWLNRATDEQQLVRLVAEGARDISPFALLALDLPGDEAARFQKRAAKNFVDSTIAMPVVPSHADSTRRPANARLRIGYLSADVHEHATMHLLQGVLEDHDRERFSIHFYSYGRTFDEASLKAKNFCEVFRDISRISDVDAAAIVTADDIDILVDLKGYTLDTRLGISARRPAPVLVNWLGYPGTLGHSALADFIIGDPIVTPPSHAADFSETLALMPHCYQPNVRERTVASRPDRLQVGLGQSSFVFCSFNQSYKLNPDTLRNWCHLLTDVPHSVLWLLMPSDAAIDNLRNFCGAHGVGPDRLVFAPVVPLSEHLARLPLADLALDTFPYNSHTTGSDALRMGVPLVTRMGRTFASRVASSLLHTMGVPELVTTSWNEYFALARSLALDASRLSALKSKIVAASSVSPLFDTKGFTRDLERLYLRMWGQQASGTERKMIALEPRQRHPDV